MSFFNPLHCVITMTLLFILHTTVYAQHDQDFAPPEKAPEIRAQKAKGTLTVDGKLNEADWASTEAITDFFRVEPRQGGDPQYRTWVKVLFDQKNLYVGAFCQDSLGKSGVRVQDLRRDFRWGENDIFLIQLDAQNLQQYCVSFQTTPYGNQRDLQNYNDSFTDNDWNALWTVRTHRTDSGYYAEFAIPFKTIRYSEESAAWGITLSRLARRDYEQTVFPAIPQSFSPYRMTYAAQLTGLELPEPSANVRIEPYLLYQYENNDQAGSSSSSNEVRPGGDVKWAINPYTVLDLTINTDFAQAEVDRAVNNLERFNIFFPERRQFFLENSGIWAGAGNYSIVPFFSRTIGLQGTFNAEPARIEAGGRYTMRTEDRSIAGLYIKQAETPNSPGANFGVARYAMNYGKENNWGIMATHRMDQQSSALGTQQSNNTTLTIDGRIRPKDQLTIQYLLSGARDNSNDTLGIAGYMYADYSANKVYLQWLSNFVSSEYYPDMGFVFQRNVMWHRPGGYYIWRPKGIPWIRRIDPGVFVNYYHDFEDPGQFQQANIYLFPLYAFFTNGSFIEYAILPTWQNINFGFVPLGVAIAEDDYYYTRQKVRFYTDRSAKISISGTVDWGEFYNGKRTTINAGLRFVPIPHVAFTADYEHNDINDLGENRESLSTHLTTIGSRFAVNPRIQLSAFYQYNTFDEQGRWNIRGSWEYRPLSFIYLVYNNTRNEGFENPLEQQQFIGKVTFMKQF